MCKAKYFIYIYIKIKYFYYFKLSKSCIIEIISLSTSKTFCCKFTETARAVNVK